MDPSQKKQDDELLQLVTFSIGEEEFGVNILKVQEIIRTMEITKVPRAPEFVEGVINLRGKVIPIIDLRRRFGLAPKAHDKNTRIIVIEINNIIVGFVVDAVSEVLRIPASTAAGGGRRGFRLYQRRRQIAGSASDHAGSGQTAFQRRHGHAQHHVTVFIRAPAFGALQQQKTDRPERFARLLRQ